MKRMMQALLLACAVGFGLAAVISSPANAIVITFDENGHCTWDAAGACAGALAPDPSNGNSLALTYFLPIVVGNGDVGVLEFGSLVPPFSDGLRFTDSSGHLTGVTADRLIFYSLIGGGALADTGLPANFGTGITGGPVTEDAFGHFTYNIGNIYNGISDGDLAVPEPATIALLGAGLLGLGAVRRRRKTKV